MTCKLISLSAIILLGFSFKTVEKNTPVSPTLKIEWVEEINGDFSFVEEWDYPEFVYKNQFGQLSCDGDCPVEIDQMKGEDGKIIQDSLPAFYQVIDTTHLYHSLHSENRMYEYSGTNYIEFTKLKNGTIRGKSRTNVSTHSSLIIELDNDSCSAHVLLNSIRDLGMNTFPLKSGTIKMDKKAFEMGIVKAAFDFIFEDTLEADKGLYWRGLIYSQIKL